MGAIRELKAKEDIQRQEAEVKWRKEVSRITGDRNAVPTDAQRKQSDTAFNAYGAAENDIGRRIAEEYNERFHAEAVLLREEMLSRLPREERYAQRTINTGYAYENPFAGASGYETVANDLDRLAKSLSAK